jgi:transposase
MPHPEKKKRALELYRAHNLKSSQIAERLGIRTSTISRWIKDSKCLPDEAMKAETPKLSVGGLSLHQPESAGILHERDILTPSNQPRK